MNKYTELSDFEINRRIAEIDTKNRYVYFEKEQTIFRKFNNGQTQKFNPCNYPSDAMPIIIDNKICTAFDVFAEEHDGGNWVASPAYGFANERTRSNNLYRAAMELFLLIKDAENEN
ncbi:phage protein NinX family protein [Providencia sp. 1701011]|uniref:phage protein NinX family protein n=1 Tax=Providencia sp. 1701011 TaxID=2603244 RepID=UPI0034D60520